MSKQINHIYEFGEFRFALEREPVGRSAFINGACAGDEELR